jgi:hypothetical protein
VKNTLPMWLTGASAGTGLALSVGDCFATDFFGPTATGAEFVDAAAATLSATRTSPGVAAFMRAGVQYSPPCWVCGTTQRSTSADSAAAAAPTPPAVTRPPVASIAPIASAAKAPDLNVVLFMVFTPVIDHIRRTPKRRRYGDELGG